MKKINIILVSALILVSTFSYSTEKVTNQASNFISDLANRVISIVQKDNLSSEAKEEQLNELFLKSVDTKWIAKFSMGRYWRQLDSTQKNDFLNL